jgi:hypothetical protein
MAELAGHGVTGNTLATALAAPVIRINNTAGQDGTVRADILPSHLESEPVEAAESGQVRALEGSVEHEGLAVEIEILDNLILSQGPHLNRNSFPAPKPLRGSADYTLDSEEPVWVPGNGMFTG